MTAAATMNPAVMQPVMTNMTAQPAVGCWQGFVNGSKAVGSWCATQAQAIGGAVKKAAIWAANFFAALGAGIVMFAKFYARELIIGSVAFAVGLAIAFIFSRCCGWCNKPADQVVEQTPAAGNTEAQARARELAEEAIVVREALRETASV